MRSRSCSTAEGGGIQAQGKACSKQQQVEEGQKEAPQVLKRRKKIQNQEKDGRPETTQSGDGTAKCPERRRTSRLDLSRTDLLQLLGVMEGEVQARDDVIRLLRSDRTGPETLEAQYGSAAPCRPLQALRRDATLLHGNQRTEDVYERPMAELQRLEDKQTETFSRMLEQLLLAEKLHRRTIMELEAEKRRHTESISKTSDFTSLLEQDRDRLKRLLEQEKSLQARRDQDQRRRLDSLQDELGKLRCFALLLADERQLQVQHIGRQNQTIQDLERRLASSGAAALQDGQKALRLEAELEARQARSRQEHQDLLAKMADQESQNRQLRLKLDGLVQTAEELQARNAQLQRSEQDLLQQLRETIGSGGNDSLTAELDSLRKKLLDLEGKDEDISRTETQCGELRVRLQHEQNRSQELRLQLDGLQTRTAALQGLEAANGSSRTESDQLQRHLERERKALKDLGSDLERLRTRLRELESSESKLEANESALREELLKLKSFAVILADERKTTGQRLQQEQQKRRDLSASLKAEQGKVTEVTERLIEESKTFLKFKSDTEVQLEGLTVEREELRSALRTSQEELKRTGADRREETDRHREEDERVQTLTAEVERLRGRLEQLQVVEGDLGRSEDEYDLLQKKFRQEQDRANALSALLDQMKAQADTGQARSLEAQLRIRCKVEEAKTRELRVQVQALKEKIHQLMNKEDQLSQLQVDFSVLQRRFLEEEERKRRLSADVEKLSRELEASRRYSRALRPGVNGRRMVDVPVACAAVQTESDGSAEDETAAGFIRKSVQEENHLMSNLRQRGLKRPAVLDRYPPASAEHGPSAPWMGRKETGGSCPMSPSLGRPLHIRVTPAPCGSSSATLEITGPRAEDFFSSATIVPTLGLQPPRVTAVPTDPPGLRSPVTLTSMSRSPERPTGVSGVPRSPVSIITVSTTPVAEACASAEPHQGGARRTPLNMASEKPADRRFSSSIVTTEDNKIHIQLGSQVQRSAEGGGGPLRPTGSGCDCQETGPVLRPPRQTKMTSSITIKPVATAASRPAQSLLGPDVASAPGPDVASAPGPDVASAPGPDVASAPGPDVASAPGPDVASAPGPDVAAPGLDVAAPGPDVAPGPGSASRIPVQLHRKTVLGVSAVTRLESRAGGQAMKIELRKATVCSSASAAAGKS